MPTNTAIRVSMKPRHRKLAERLVKSGRFASASEVLARGMTLLEAEERELAECVEGIRRGLADAAAGRDEPWEDFRRDFERRHGLRRERVRRAK